MDAQHDGLDYHLYVDYREFEKLKSGEVLTAPLVHYSGATHGKTAKLSVANEIPDGARASYVRNGSGLENLEVAIDLRMMDEWWINRTVIALFETMSDSRVRVILRA